MMFWVVSGAMTALALLVVVLPLLRRKQVRDSDRRGQNIAVYQDRLRELEAETEAGFMSSDEFASARDELLQRLPGDLKGSETEETLPGRRRRWSAMAVLVMIPLLGVVLYVGSGGAQRLKSAQAAPKLKDMGVRLSKEMKAHPDDPRGWFLLGRVRMSLGRYQKAASAFGQAVAHMDTPGVGLLTAQAQALGMSRNGDFRGKPQEILERALRKKPDDTKALWYSAIAAQQAGQPSRALGYWGKIDPKQIPDQLRSVLEQHKTRARRAVMSAPGKFSIPVRVSLAPEVRKKVDDNDAVFIFARGVKGPGHPLAAVRRKVSDLPLKIDLTNNMGMGPGQSLSSRKGWILVARISLHDRPEARPGDWYVKRTVEKAQLDGVVGLRIHKQVP